MNLEQIEAIHAVIEQGSFRAAAENLNRSQPALSACIKNLEEEFNFEIFDRSSYRPTLTKSGRALYEASKRFLEAARYLQRVGNELGKQQIESELRVAVDPLIPVEVIGIIAQECARPTYPVNLVMSKAVLKSGAKDLLASNADIALAPCPENDSELEKISLKSVELVAAVSRSLLGEQNKATDDFLATRAQVLIYDRRFDEPADTLIGQPVHGGGGPKIYAPDHFTKLNLIKASLGWGRISREELALSPNLVEVDSTLCPHVTLHLCAMRPKNRPIGPIARKIWSALEHLPTPIATK